MKFLKRLREPSTWAGVSALAVLAGVPPGTLDLVYQLVIGGAALVAVVAPESRAD